MRALNRESSSMRENNIHLEETVNALQRKINLCTKENAELCDELKRIQNERDIAVDTSAKNNELLHRMVRYADSYLLTYRTYTYTYV